MKELRELKDNINKLFKTLVISFILSIRIRKISKIERKIQKLEINLEIKRKIYRDYLIETRTIVNKIRKESE